MSDVKVEQETKDRMRLLTEQVHLTYQQVLVLCREIDRINKLIGYENVLPIKKETIK